MCTTWEPFAGHGAAPGHRSLHPSSILPPQLHPAPPTPKKKKLLLTQSSLWLPFPRQGHYGEAAPRPPTQRTPPSTVPSAGGGHCPRPPSTVGLRGAPPRPHPAPRWAPSSSPCGRRRSHRPHAWLVGGTPSSPWARGAPWGRPLPPPLPGTHRPCPAPGVAAGRRAGWSRSGRGPGARGRGFGAARGAGGR